MQGFAPRLDWEKHYETTFEGQKVQFGALFAGCIFPRVGATLMIIDATCNFEFEQI